VDGFLRVYAEEEVNLRLTDSLVKAGLGHEIRSPPVSFSVVESDVR
jgi:hypothetical protein